MWLKAAVVRSALHGSEQAQGGQPLIANRVLPDCCLIANWRRRINLAALQASADTLRAFPPLPPASASLPACFIAGDRSGYLATDPQRAAARALFPSAVFETVASGHWVHAEAPEAFVRLVCDFCSRV